jgi:UDP-N-acetylglucosamine 2-epimerase (non-hydrolysing)
VRVTLGTNVVIGQEGNRLSSELGRIVAGRAKKGTIPPLWDGHAGERIADVLQSLSI